MATRRDAAARASRPTLGGLWPGRRAPSSRFRSTALFFVSVMAMITVTSLFTAAYGLEDDEAGARHVLVLIAEPPADTTVHQRIHLELDASQGNRTFGIAVPMQAANHEVADADGRPLAWSASSSGVLQVGLAPGTRSIDVVSRGIPAPSDGQAIRFGADDPARPLWLVIGVAPEIQAEAFGLPLVTHERLRATSAVPGEWPLPEHWEFAWNEGEDRMLPERIEPAAGALRPALSPYALGAGVAVLLALLTLWLVVRIHRGVADPTRTRKQPVMKHLEELRRRIVTVGVLLLLATAFFFSFGFRWVSVANTALPLPSPSLHQNAASQLFAWLASSIVPEGVDVVVVAPFDAVATLLVLSFALGVLVTFPVLIYHAYAFLAPALHPHERRLVLVASPAVIILFVLGALFGLLLMAPLIVMVLYGFAAAAGALALLTMPQLVSIAALMSLMFGIAFQLPVVMMLTARMGLVRAAAYRRQWRWAVVIIVIVAALVTDPTVITQIIVAVVLMGLYGIGLLLAWLVDRRREPPPVE